MAKTDTAAAPAEAAENMASIAKAAEERAQALVGEARAANARAEKALAELDGNPLMTNGMGKAVKELHETAKATDARLQGLMKRIHEHFHPPAPEKKEEAHA